MGVTLGCYGNRQPSEGAECWGVQRLGTATQVSELGMHGWQNRGSEKLGTNPGPLRSLL